MDYAYGSKYQLQRWATERSDDLNRRLLEVSPTLQDWALGIEWLAPVEGFEAELGDTAWREVGLSGPSPVEARWWPRGGPVWDGVARVRGPAGQVGALFIEAKGRQTEVRGRSCRATDPESRHTIVEALRDVQSAIGVGFDANWLGPAYQPANRLAVLWFARERRDPAVPVWLVSVYFLGERYPTPAGDAVGPSTEAEWRPIIADLHREMDLPNPPHVLSDWWIELFIEALDPRPQSISPVRT